ncbi:MAG: hypothetical protein AAFW95_10110, partial [Cyanobacteria bacterium J06638_6]
FDVDDYSAEAVIAGWLEQFGSVWVSHAITEALYQGRYKVVSIDHILKLWQRRGNPIRHFNREFESIILGQALLYPASNGEGSQDAAPASQTDPSPPATLAASQTEPPAANPVNKAAIAASPSQDLSSIPNPEPPLTDPDLKSEKIPNFRPLTSAPDSTELQTDEIRPFVPRQDDSDLHQRLQAVFKGGMRE